LTQEFINSKLTCPPDIRKIEFCCREIRGFYVEVRSASQGQGTYYLRYRNNGGKLLHQKIGLTSVMDLATARKQARTLKSQVQLGGDPRGEEKARRAIMTLGEYFDSHYLPHAKKHKRSWERDVQLFSRIKIKFGDLRLTDLRRYAIQEFHGSLEGEGLAQATCDHHVKLLKRMINLAIKWELLKGDNPAVGVTMFNPRNEIEHYMSDEQRQRLLEVLRTDANRAICRIMLFLLATGARLNEALTATWKNVDRSALVWRIEALNSKSKRMRSVPLNEVALEALAELDGEGEFDHVFVNRDTKKQYTSVQKVWTRLRKKAGMPHLRIHDLRHEHASLVISSGHTLYEVQALLGHSDPKVTMRYAHLSSKALQDASNSASTALKGKLPKAA
jgi:integrase